MHNWRLLLLAFVAVFQPIASFAEGLVDGRQQRCDLRTASLRRDPGLPFHGPHHFTKPLDARCLSERDIRAVRRNELREDLRSIKTPERRLVDTLERRGRTSKLGSTQAENRLAIDNIILRRETRSQFRSEDRSQRNREIERDRLSIASDTRRNRLERGRHSNKFEDEIRINSRRSVASRTSMESRRDTDRYRDSTNLQRVQEIRVTRAVSERARDDLTASSRRGRERVQEMRRAEFRVQQERNGQHQILNQRSGNTEPRSSSFSSVRIYRAYNNEDSRRDTQSLDREERLNTRSRRSIDESKPQLDSRITSRVRVSAEQKIIRDSPERREYRRVLGERDARQLGRQREERSAEWDRDTRLTRATRFEANRVSRNLRTDALMEQRARSAENRRNVKDIRNMELNFRTDERSIENQRAYRLADRESVADNRREIRNINTESRVVTQYRAAENNRKVHNIVRESREIRDIADKENESCSLNRARSTERRMTGQDSERVSRILTARRDEQSQNIIRNTERDARVLGRERAEINRNVDRDTRIFGRERTTERNIRMNLVDVRSARKERSLENQRDTRNAEFQRVRLERSSRRDVRNVERLTSSLERVINHLDTRDNVIESIEKRASSETRANRDSQRDFRTATLGRRDSRNIERQSRQIGDKLIIDNVRTTRFVDREARRERSAESRRDIRQVPLPQVTVNRRERASDNRRIRNIDRDTRAFRTVKARSASRVDTENVRDYHLKERENSRVAERLNMRDARRSRSVRLSNSEARRNSERNNFEMERREAESRYRFNTEFARKREFLNTMQNSQAENETSSMNWQYLVYTLQGLYICGILSQLMNERAGKKPRALSWYSTHQHLIKVD